MNISLKVRVRIRVRVRRDSTPYLMNISLKMPYLNP